MSVTVLESKLGLSGRMISGSKIAYIQLHPSHKVFFNACMFNEDKQLIWWGDIDLTVDSPLLQELADEIGTIYVTREYPFRFEGFDKGKEREPEGYVVFHKQ